MMNTSAIPKGKVIVAMSGGVDSSVAAGLMKRAGHDVVGVTLRLLTRGASGFGCCGNPDDMAVAKRSAEALGIPHYVLDYSQDFEKDVINYFVDSYLAGETPNPCVACNRYIKFDRLDKFADSLGAKHLVTGHYAHVEWDESEKVFRLFEGADPNKDQSYVLYNITQDALRRTHLPVGQFTKPEIRNLAHEFGLPNAEKAESMEICFVPNRDTAGFVKMKIAEREFPPPITAQPGDIKDISGNVIGQHKGVAFYTVGQRKGLGLTTKEPYYVIRLDPTNNVVIAGPDRVGTSPGLSAFDLNWIIGRPPQNQFRAFIKIRYKHEPAPGMVTVQDDKVTVEFDEPQRAVTPGQSVVFYGETKGQYGREVLGGGTIKEALS